MKNWQLALIVVLSVVGFVCTFAAGVDYGRLDVEGVDAGPWDYAYMVALPLVGTFICAAVRVGFRFFAVPPTPEDGKAAVKPMPKWLGKAAKGYADSGDTVGLNKLVTSMIDYEKAKA